MPSAPSILATTRTTRSIRLHVASDPRAPGRRVRSLALPSRATGGARESRRFRAWKQHQVLRLRRHRLRRRRGDGGALGQSGARRVAGLALRRRCRCAPADVHFAHPRQRHRTRRSDRQRRASLVLDPAGRIHPGDQRSPDLGHDRLRRRSGSGLPAQSVSAFRCEPARQPVPDVGGRGDGAGLAGRSAARDRREPQPGLPVARREGPELLRAAVEHSGSRQQPGQGRFADARFFARMEMAHHARAGVGLRLSQQELDGEASRVSRPAARRGAARTAGDLGRGPGVVAAPGLDVRVRLPALPVQLGRRVRKSDRAAAAARSPARRQGRRRFRFREPERLQVRHRVARHTGPRPARGLHRRHADQSAFRDAVRCVRAGDRDHAIHRRRDLDDARLGTERLRVSLPRKSVHGEGSIPAAFGGGEADAIFEGVGAGISIGKRFGAR